MIVERLGDDKRKQKGGELHRYHAELQKMINGMLTLLMAAISLALENQFLSKRFARALSVTLYSRPRDVQQSLRIFSVDAKGDSFCSPLVRPLGVEPTVDPVGKD